MNNCATTYERHSATIWENIIMALSEVLTNSHSKAGISYLRPHSEPKEAPFGSPSWGPHLGSQVRSPTLGSHSEPNSDPRLGPPPFGALFYLGFPFGTLLGVSIWAKTKMRKHRRGQSESHRGVQGEPLSAGLAARATARSIQNSMVSTLGNYHAV